MPNIYRLYIILLCCGLCSCHSKQAQKATPILAINIDGSLNEAIWQEVDKKVLKNLTNKKASKWSVFKHFSDDNNFYFGFRIADPNTIQRKLEYEKNIWESADRVELFFAEDATLQNYYGIEITPNGSYSDFKAKHYRQLNFDWNWQQNELDIKTKQSERGYVVEGRISLSLLHKLNLIQNDKILLAILRADYYDNNDIHAVEWYSWKYDKSNEIDFHKSHVFDFIDLK